MPKGLLEVIALDADDARRAVAGGADRLELVSGMEVSGLCPAPQTVEAVLAASNVPVRVMLRLRADFVIGGKEGMEEIVEAAVRLLAAGAEEFVIGWLDERGEVEHNALLRAREALDGRPFTFHKAIDQVADREVAFAKIRGIPGLDTVLTSGGPFPAGQGVDQLAQEARREASLGADSLRLLVGGGLKVTDVPVLKAAGLTDFHVGSAVRGAGGWSGKVDPDLVALWRDVIDS